MSDLLRVADLRVLFPGRHGEETAPVDGVSLAVGVGETVAVVGESGSGKTLTALAVIGLVPPPGRIGGGSRILFEGTDLTSAGQETRRGVRGGRIGMVFQNAATSLNPVLSVGAQIRETVLAHHRLTGREARDRAVALLAETGMPDPARRYGAFPHELSGGQKQRALIAIALAGEPSLLIADEPTTALDVTVQAQILELIDRLRERRGMAVLLVTHDLGIVARRADRVVVMLAGRIVEEAPTRDLFTRPAHEYTRALLGAVPRLTGARLS